MTQNIQLYIEILAQPGETCETTLDRLELALCHCIYQGFTHCVVNLSLIKTYDVMFVRPLFEMLTGLEIAGGSFIITQPPPVFAQEFEELYAISSIELVMTRESILNEKRDILHTFLEDDETIVDTLVREAASHLPHDIGEPVVIEPVLQSEKIPEILEPEIITSNISCSYFNPEKNIEICTISGEYTCTACTTREYFMKGFPFDACSVQNCIGGNTHWKLTKRVF